MSPRTVCQGERIESFEIPELCDQDLRPGDFVKNCELENLSYRDPTRTPKCTQRPHEDRAYEDRASGVKMTTVVKLFNSWD